MSEQEEFEQPVLEAIISAIESYEKNDLDGWELYLVKRRAELADKEIAELKAQVALDESLMAESTRTIQELEAQIVELKGKQNETAQVGKRKLENENEI